MNLLARVINYWRVAEIFGPSLPLCMATLKHAHFVFDLLAQLRFYGKVFIFCFMQLSRKLIMRKIEVVIQCSKMDGCSPPRKRIGHFI